MKIFLFTRSDDPYQKKAKLLFKKLTFLGFVAELFNIDERCGQIEGAFYDVLQLPSLLLVDKEGNVLKAWRGGAELPEDVENIVREFRAISL